MSLPHLVRLRSSFGGGSVSSACLWRMWGVGVEFMAVGDAAVAAAVVGVAAGVAVEVVVGAVAGAVAVAVTVAVKKAVGAAVAVK